MLGNELLDDADTIKTHRKRIERNSHDHHSHGHGHGHGHGNHGHEGGGDDLLEFFRQIGLRLTDGKDREGANDLGNGKSFCTYFSTSGNPSHLILTCLSFFSTNAFLCLIFFRS